MTPPSIALFSLDRGHPLLERVAKLVGVAPSRHEEREFEDGEHKIRPLECVRGRDVYVIESLFGDADRSAGDAPAGPPGSRRGPPFPNHASHAWGPELSVNDKLARVLFFLGALRDAGAERITMVAPYLCYARKDRRTKPRDPVTTRYVAALFEALRVDRMVVVDVHNPAAYQNAFRIPTVHLTAAPLLVDAFAARLGDHEVVVVSPDAGGVKRADHFREALEQRLERPVGFAFMEKFRSEGVVRGGALVGEVEGRAAIILDDLVASGTTLVRAAAACRQHGATIAYAAVTHGVWASTAERSLDDAALERLLITDTIPPDRLDPAFVRRRIDVIDCAPLLARAIMRLHGDQSLVELSG
ncbi:MAG TPA: ribose-phosphate diphosphokinase [Enhygromyxa sp.]|nr:ribose-phosphate diphosphokinase [Enhygromyxa sp.]